MSIICNFYYTVTENGKRRVIIGYELRKLLLARYKAQRNMYEFNRRVGKGAKQAGHVNGMGRRFDAAGKDLDGMGAALGEAEAELESARADLERQIEAMAQMQKESGVDAEGINQMVADARQALEDVERLAGLPTDADFSDDGLDPEEIKARIAELETELRFLSHHEQYQPAAMATLEAMRENGYELREAETKDGLISWFEQKETGCQIAIRVADPVRSGENDTWELVAETFEMTGETCLFEIEDFETSLEDSGFGELKTGNMRHYPKDQRSADREKRGFLPSLKSRRGGRAKRKDWVREKTIS